MCINRRVIKKNTIKYWFPIPQLENNLNKLIGSYVLSKIDLGVTIKLEWVVDSCIQDTGWALQLASNAIWTL